MGVQERSYMGQDATVRPDPDPTIEEPNVPIDLSTPSTKALKTAIQGVEAEVKKLKDVINEKDELITLLKQRVMEAGAANLARPEWEPIVETVAMMLCGLVYCRPIDEADRQRIVTAAEKGHALLDVIAGMPVNFPAARLLYEAAAREYHSFISNLK